MKNSKLLLFINLILLCSSLTLNADETKKPAAQTNPKPIIKFAPDYKKTTLDSTSSQDSYKRAIRIEIDKSIDEEAMNKMVEERCRSYNLKQRKNYFVTFINNMSGKEIKRTSCDEVTGTIIETSDNKSSKTTPVKQPYIVQ